MIEDKKFEEKFLNSIKEKKIEPRSKWYFRLKEYSIWIAGAVFLLVGAISVSLIIQMVRLRELGRFMETRHNPFEIIFLILPIFWLALLTGFIVVVYYDFKMTKRGYRYSPAVIVAVAVLSSIALGGIFAKAGYGKKVDDIISQNVPEKFYGGVINPHIKFWSNPGEGRIAGLITEKINESRYDLLDTERKQWILIIASNAEGGEELNPGRPVRATGKEISANEFQADEILPMEIGRGFFLKRKFAGPNLPSPGVGEGNLFFLSEGEKGRVKIFKGCPEDESLIGIFEAYPELKTDFVNNLKKKNNIGEIMRNDPDFKIRLKALNIDEPTIIYLEKK